MRLRRIAVGAGVILAGLTVLNRRLGEIGEPARIGGEERRYPWREGVLAYRVAGEPGAPPLLLVHGIYAGASSYEFRKNFLELATQFRVYALDLLGCGLSDRPQHTYTPEDIAAQVEDFAREEIGIPTYLVASSLSAALITPVAVRSPRLFKKLVLICPTGLGGNLDRPSGRLGDVVYNLFQTPVLGDSLYHAIVSHRGISYYLKSMAYHDSELVTEDLIRDYYRTSHQLGAKHLPAAFVSGKLNLGLGDLWSRVPHKSLVAWGQEARTTPVSNINSFLRNNPRTEPRIFRNAALLPHDERAEAFNAEVRDFFIGDARRRGA